MKQLKDWTTEEAQENHALWTSCQWILSGFSTLLLHRWAIVDKSDKPVWISFAWSLKRGWGHLLWFSHGDIVTIKLDSMGLHKYHAVSVCKLQCELTLSTTFLPFQETELQEPLLCSSLPSKDQFPVWRQPLPLPWLPASAHNLTSSFEEEELWERDFQVGR